MVDRLNQKYFRFINVKVYLARMEGKSTGKISWRIKIENSSHVIVKVKIRACSKSFENGSVKWTLSGENGKIEETLPRDSSKFAEFTDTLHDSGYSVEFMRCSKVEMEVSGTPMPFVTCIIFREYLKYVEIATL